MAAKSYSKDDLKRLMNERKQEQLKNKKIDSPLAGYDKDGILFCKVCELNIENINLWTKHLVSKEHKLTLERIKKGQTVNPQQQQEIKKRKLIDKQEDTKQKQQRTDSDSILKDDSEEKQQSNDNSSIDQSSSNVQVGTDLPKGFFDNAEEDAKARDEIYKDPMDEEWSKFQRTMQVENRVVDNLNENELVEAQNYRELNEIDEQIEHWNKINELEIKRDAMKLHKKMEIDRGQELTDDSDDDEVDLENEFMERSFYSTYRKTRCFLVER